MINNIFVYGPFTSNCCCTPDLLIATNQQKLQNTDTRVIWQT